MYQASFVQRTIASFALSPCYLGPRIVSSSGKLDDAALRAFFEPLALSAIRWVTDRETGDFKGCGFAEFASTEDADQAFKKQGQVLMSRPVRLDWAEDKPKKWEQ